MMNPDMLLFDEPTSSFGPAIDRRSIAGHAQSRQRKMTMIVVTHEMGFAREAANRVLFMMDKEIVETGTPAEIFNQPKNPKIKEFIESIL